MKEAPKDTSRVWIEIDTTEKDGTPVKEFISAEIPALNYFASLSVTPPAEDKPAIESTPPTGKP